MWPFHGLIGNIAEYLQQHINTRAVDPDTAILVGAGLATTGWLYTARRGRILARKQHSLNVMLTASFNNEFRAAYKEIAPHMRAGNLAPVRPDDEQRAVLRDSLRLVLNHYEFVAAGIRNGDLDETLIRDSERSTIVTLFTVCQVHIESLRTTRSRRSLHEHLEWLYRRWETNRPGRVQKIAEFIRGRPFQGQREKTHRK